MRQYELPGRSESSESLQTPQEGFTVRGAPWSQKKQQQSPQSASNGTVNAPDTASTSDFPEFGASAVKQSQVAWGPSIKQFGKR